MKMQIPIITRLVAIYFIASSFTSALAANTDMDAKQEILLKEQIQKEPTSEARLFAYATFLYNHDRFAEAKQTLTKLFALNKNHVYGQKMWASIQQLEAVTDPAERNKIKLAFASDEIHSEMDEFHKAVAQMPAVAVSDAEEKKKQALMEKYRPCMRKESNEPLSNTKELNVINEYERAGKTDEAEKMYLAFIDKHSESVRAISELAQFYIKHDKLDAAKRYITEGQKRFPDTFQLDVLNDYMPKLTSAQSIEQKNDAKGEMNYTLMQLNLMHANCLMNSINKKMSDNKN